MELAIGIILGGLIAWGCSKYYYEKAAKDLKEAAKDLKRETEEVKRLINYMLLGMEKQGWVTLDRDSQGNIVGYKFTLEVHGAIMPTGSTSPTLIQTAKKEEEKKGVEPD